MGNQYLKKMGLLLGERRTNMSKDFYQVKKDTGTSIISLDMSTDVAWVLVIALEKHKPEMAKMIEAAIFKKN